MQEETIESLARKQGTNESIMGGEQDMVIPDNSIVCAPGKQKDGAGEKGATQTKRKNGKQGEKVKEQNEFDINYRFYFIVLMAEFALAGLVLIGGVVFAGIQTDWKFD